MRTVADLFLRTIHRLHREPRQGICAVMVKPDSKVGIVGAYSIAGAGTEAMEFAAETFLDLIVQEGAKDDTACLCCLDRIERARQALAIIRLRPKTRMAH